MNTKDTKFEQLTHLLGSRRKIAAICGVTQQAVYWWSRGHRIAPKHVKLLEAATGGLVTRAELRPDIYDSE